VGGARDAFGYTAWFSRHRCHGCGPLSWASGHAVGTKEPAVSGSWVRSIWSDSRATCQVVVRLLSSADLNLVDDGDRVAGRSRVSVVYALLGGPWSALPAQPERT
jgi:hypothetical protein